MKNWYIESADEAVSAFSSDKENGLSEDQLRQAALSYGKNKLREKENKSFARHFFERLKHIIVITLIIAAFVSLVVEIVEAHGKPINFAEPITIIAIVILHAVLLAVYKTRARSYLDTVHKMTAPLSKVKRCGKICVIPSEDIVPGDIVLLDAGDIIPADGRILKCISFSCDESSLTGDCVPSLKNADAHIDVTCPVSDRKNMVYSGCSVSSGCAEFIVTATGMRTEAGNTAGILANEYEEQSPFKNQLAQLGKYIALSALIVCTVIFLFGAYITKDWLHIFTTAVSLAVAVLPEVLTAIVILTFGVQRMVKKKAIIKNLSSIEALSGTSVICSDKTGTLTLNKMALVRAWSYEDNALRNIGELVPSDDKSVVKLIQLAAICCDAVIEKDENGNISETGDSVEIAIISALMELGQEKHELLSAYKRIFELPFDFDRKLMTTVHSTDSGIVSITKGAPDVVVSRCPGVDKDKVMAVCNFMGKDSLRVLAVACKKLTNADELHGDELEFELTFMGLIGIIDPLRSEVRTAIQACHEAGIRTVMITGDHIVTASAIAKELGILSEGEEAISGEELKEMSDADFFSSVRKYSVYARITPSDKTRIIKAWQDAGETVAVTGSSVSDLPSLKTADIGCGMGCAGTDAAKEASDLILTDDSFTAIASAACEGRGIFGNIRKSVRFLLSCNLGEAIAIFFCILIFKVSPLAAIHLLFINLIINFFPTLALGMDPVDPELMKRKPKDKDEGILTKKSAVRTAVDGIFLAALTVIAYAVGYTLSGKDTAAASTMAFGVLSLSQLIHILTVRTRTTVFGKAFVSNKIMLYAQIGSISIILLSMLLPPFMKIFSFVYLSGKMWLWILLLSLIPIVISEIAKASEKLYSKYTGHNPI